MASSLKIAVRGDVVVQGLAGKNSEAQFLKMP
jgi:hypothetical protein